jgi:hypothetical protein
VTERGKRSSLPATSLSPVSGSFGDCQLDLTKTLDSAGWSVGQHRLSVSAKSQDGSSRRSPTGPVVTGPSDLVFADSFETANVNQWSGSRNASDLRVTKGAAMIGAHGLRVTVHRGSRTYLTDEAPTGLARYRARFWFKPDLARTQRKGHRIFVGNRGDGSMLFAIRYRHLANDTDSLRLGASTAAGPKWTSWRTIAAGAHRLELSWQNGTNGQATLFVDGVQRARLVQPSVGSSTLEQVQLGSVTPPKGAASGAELFDGFASTVSTTIGN